MMYLAIKSPVVITLFSQFKCFAVLVGIALLCSSDS